MDHPKAKMERAENGTYQFFDHAADVGLEMRSPTLSGLFSTAALALLSWIGPVPEGDKLFKTRVEVIGDSLEELLVRWLQEILYLFYQRHAYITGMGACDIENNYRITANVIYKVWDESCRQDYQEVKAVTYHQLKIWQNDAGWLARVIIDI